MNKYISYPLDFRLTAIKTAVKIQSEVMIPTPDLVCHSKERRG